MEEVLIPVIAITSTLIGLPWLVFHYITKWKSNASLTAEDENLLDELHETARRLDDRLCSIERIMTAENPGWRALACDPADIGIDDATLQTSMRRIKQ
ncbi:MAG: envelope stress response membrane protein PspB [Pseudomonadota bacterium]|nr:envelope stress response membrane protein PspB [Pseudomonadota bacterium]